MGVGVIGASPLRPGWAVTAHLPALAALPDYELRAVATSTEASARAAAEAYGVPGHADPAALIARRDVDLVVVTVKLPHHHRLVGEALAAGKLVMCEWPLGVDAGQTADLAARAAGAGLGTLIGLQARMAPSIRYARDLVAQGYVGEVLATTLVGSGIAWTSVTDSAHAYMFEAAGNATLLSVPTMHALDALQFVLGDLADIRATSAVRRPAVTLADTQETITATAPDHLAIAATLKSGAVASVCYRGGTSRALHAEHLGIRHLGPEQTLTHADVHEVHAGGVDLDQGLSRPRCRFRYIHQFEHVRATGPTNSHHPHVSVSVTGRCAMPLTAALVMKSSV